MLDASMTSRLRAAFLLRRWHWDLTKAKQQIALNSLFFKG